MDYKFLASYILILIALFYSYKEKLGVERELLVNSIRAFIQLLVLGYTLVYIFKIKNQYLLLGVLFFMVSFAAFTAQRRVKLLRYGFFYAMFCIGTASFLVIFSLLALKIISTKPNELIPVGGMVVGNSLNVYTLVVDRLKGEISSKVSLVENMIALGASLRQALHEIKKVAVKSALIPTINSLQTVGIIHIPGITTGMLLAGASPLEAVSYQLAIMYMMVAVALFTSTITVSFGYRVVFDTVVGGRHVI